LELADRIGIPADTRHTIPVGITHHEIAIIIGSTREIVSELIGQLRNEAMIEFDRQKIRILNRKSLTLELTSSLN